MIKNIKFVIYSGQKILLEGKNGRGKSSFLKALMNLSNNQNQSKDLEVDQKSSQITLVKNLEQKSNRNDSVSNYYFSKDLKIIYLDQNYSNVNQNLSLENNLKLGDPEISSTELYKLLAYFNFSKNVVNQLAKNLSGGELVRLAIAILTLQKVDILILDEPTNNLDISTQEVLIQVVKEFQGSLILVSHNQWFCKQIKIDIVCNLCDQKLLLAT